MSAPIYNHATYKYARARIHTCKRMRARKLIYTRRCAIRTH